MKKWLTLNDQPPANSFLKQKGDWEFHFPLAVYYCQHCELIQLIDIVHPDILFKNYVYHSSTSPVFREHFAAFAEDCVNKGLIKKNDLIVDIGSNDGILLLPFAFKYVNILGVEPSSIALKANEEGIPTIQKYFTKEVAGEIVESSGEARMVTMTNVFAHVNNIDEIVEGVKFLLEDDGYFVVEFPDTMEMLKQKTFDLIYHEHLSYFTVPSIVRYLTSKGFYVDEIRRIPVHGGSLRVYARNASLAGCSATVHKWFDKEKGFTKDVMFQTFPQEIELHRQELTDLLKELKEKGKRIVGYGAPAKMSTLTNSYNFGKEYFDFIIDDSPAKWNLLSPGKHIPVVRRPEHVHRMEVDYIFVFAWNFANSIIESLVEKGYRGGFILPYPKPKILPRKREGMHYARNSKKRS